MGAGNEIFDGTRAIETVETDDNSAEPLADAVITGIDFTLTTNTTIEISDIYIGLTGKVGQTSYSFISQDPGWVVPGEITGLPAYKGWDVLLEPGATVTDLQLEIYASTWDDQVVPIFAGIDSYPGSQAYVNFYRGNRVFMSLGDIQIPSSGSRRMLKIFFQN